MKSILKLSNVNFSYKDEEPLLKNIDASISPGQCIALIGCSGCGKSTFTRIINGLAPNFFQGKLTGNVYIENVNLKNMKTWEIGAKVGNVFQDPRSQFFSNEVIGEIAFGCENLGLTHEKIRERVNQTITTMKIEDLSKVPIYTLSYGMRQKVAICSSKAMNPDIFVFDEPSANLDLQSTYLLADLIKNLKREGKTIIIAEHRLFYIKDIVDKFFVMENGEIIKVYTSSEIKKVGSKCLNTMGLRSLELSVLKININNEQKLLNHNTISISNLGKSFNGKYIFKNINFKYDSNEVIALIGTNGTGKSTLGKAISGIDKKVEGNVYFNNIPINRKNQSDKIWYIPQDLDSQLFGENLIDELTIGMENPERFYEKAEEILNKLGLSDFKNRHPSTLSGGQKQRLILGVAMMREVEMIILDEPTSGLDYDSMEKVSKLILEEQKKGVKFLIISHDIEFIAKTCNRILKLDEGRLVEDYYLTDIKQLLLSMDYRKE